MNLQFEPGESMLVMRTRPQSSTSQATPARSEEALAGTSRQERKKFLTKEYHDGSRYKYYTDIKEKPILYVQTFHEDVPLMKATKVRDRDLMDKKLGFSFGNNLHLVDIQTATILFIYEAYGLKNWIDVQCVRRERRLIVRGRATGTEGTELALDDGFVKYATNLLTNHPTLSDADANCSYPCIHIPERKEYVSGLAACTRFIFKYSSALLRKWSHNGRGTVTNKLKPLLGFREACLQACAESSIWTKFCEEDIPVGMVRALSASFKELENAREDGVEQGSIPIPDDLLRFEYHLAQAPKIHNFSKKKQEMTKKLAKSDKRHEGETGEDKPTVAKDEEIEHAYGEGPEMSLADLILYPPVTMVLKEVFTKTTIQEHLPRVSAWRKRVKSAMPKSPFTARFNLVTKYRHFGYPTLPVVGHLPAVEVPKATLYKRDVTREGGKCNKFTAPIEFKEAVKIFTAPDNMMEYCTKEELDLSPLIDWTAVPPLVTPGAGGGLPSDRQERKNAQVANMLQMIQFVYEMTTVTRTEADTTPIRIADFCSGGGHLGIAAAWMFEDCEIYLIENKEESLRRAQKRITELGLTNVTVFQCNMTNFTGQFEIGCALHACGASADIVIRKSHHCNFAGSFVVSPCCYGKIKTNSLIKYPRSYAFEEAAEDHAYNKSKDYYSIVAHTADHSTSGESEQGRLAMRLIDTDRCRGMEEQGYKTWLKKMDPPDATPENHILVGIFDGFPIYEHDDEEDDDENDENENDDDL